MSNQLLALYNLDRNSRQQTELPFFTLPTRARNLDALTENRNVDLVIIGGGLTGALVAWNAALRDIRVVLLEPGILGAHALRWRTRIAQSERQHPWRALGSRRALEKIGISFAPHLALPSPIDARPTDTWAESLARRFLPTWDLDERLLIKELVLAARQEGAMVFQSADPIFVEAESESGCYLLGLRDHALNRQIELRAGALMIDPSRGFLPTTRLGTSVARMAPRPAGGVQRVYRVSPRNAKSGVPFVSFEITDGSFATVQRIADDGVAVTVLFQGASIEQSVLAQVCGDAVREAGWMVEQELSSREVDASRAAAFAVREERGIFTCSHRVPWDAFRSAPRIVNAMLSHSTEPPHHRRIPRRPLPGEEQGREVDAFRAEARARGISERTIELCVARWRGRVRYIAQYPAGLVEVIPGVLRGEVALAYWSDQVTSVEDLVFGSLALYNLADWRECVAAMSDELKQLTGPS